MGLYETDFYRWTQEQAGLLRAGLLDRLDIANLTEEIESMGRSEKRELINRLKVLLAHMLKWDYQPQRQSRSWSATIQTQRKELRLLLEDNPSLLQKFPIETAYDLARAYAAIETGLPEETFPAECPYTVEQIMGA